MNIADNPISKPYLGGVIVLLAYLEIKISDTLGWPQGMLYKLDLQYLRHMYTVGRSVTVVSNYFPKSVVKLRHFFEVFSQGSSKILTKHCKSLINAML